MPQIINTNIASLNAQRNLNSSQSSLATALTRLSSGLRINSAKDDAAGLAISDRFSTQIRGLNQAVRNANDGISLSQTGEGALAEVSNNLQRIRELAVQSANATNSASDRAALDLEVQQRLAEIDRISSQTNFNGRKILDGSFGNATFQVGANAGQTISLDLEGSTRLDSVGGIASTTSSVLGASATGGSVETGTISNFDFSAAGTTDGGVTVTASTFNFGTAANAGTSGQLDIAGVNGTTNFAAANAQDGINVQSAVTGFDFSGAGNEAQFDVTDGTTTVGITLSTNLASLAGVATEIQNQLQDVDANYTAAVDANGNLEITYGTAVTAVQTTAVDANAVAAGFTADVGLAGFASEKAEFTVDGHAVSLSTDLTDNAGVATEIQTQLNAAAGAGSYTVSFAAGSYEIINNTVGSTAPAIVATNAFAYTEGWDTAANLTSTAGTPAVSSTNAEFVIDGAHTVTLSTDYADFDALATDIGAKLEAASAGTYTVSNVNNEIKIINNDGATAVALTTPDNGLLDDAAIAAGFAATTGAFTGAASFEVDGNAVTLNTNTTDVAGMVAAVQGQLTGYTVAANDAGDGIKITNDTLGSAAAVIANANQNATDAGIAGVTSVDGVAGGSITLASGDFSLAVGDGTAYDFAGSYDTAQDLASAINRELSGVAAEITTDGELKLMSTDQLTMSGAQAGVGGDFGFTNLTVAANGGDLSAANVTSVSDANETIVRIDSALTEVSNLRSTFGAIQNRFESTISNLTVTAENLTASRSRIMDADFAMETANLTRAQILQQAGTAMLAQANQIPQNVLSLLR